MITTGFLYAVHRYYDPEIGRFLIEDPLGRWFDAPHGGNGYAWVGSTYRNAWDPLGFQGHKWVNHSQHAKLRAAWDALERLATDPIAQERIPWLARQMKADWYVLFYTTDTDVFTWAWCHAKDYGAVHWPGSWAIYINDDGEVQDIDDLMLTIMVELSHLSLPNEGMKEEDWAIDDEWTDEMQQQVGDYVTTLFEIRQRDEAVADAVEDAIDAVGGFVDRVFHGD